MSKKRMTLSIIVLISSVFLFVLTSFAWFAISDFINIGNPTIDLINIEATVTLYVSTDDVIYNEATEITISNSVPGTVMYYRLVIENTGDIAIHTEIDLYGFTDSVADPLGSDANYLAGNSLFDVIRVSQSNNWNSEVINNVVLSTLIPFQSSGDYSQSSATLVEDLSLAVGNTAIVSFSFTIDGNLAGNDYQNLMLEITSLAIHSVGQ